MLELPIAVLICSRMSKNSRPTPKKERNFANMTKQALVVVVVFFKSK